MQNQKNGNKQDHALKKLRLARERLNKGTSVVGLWHQISKYYASFQAKLFATLVCFNTIYAS